eukprot:6171829-Pleurochrysis_carterae.AAC.1
MFLQRRGKADETGQLKKGGGDALNLGTHAVLEGGCKVLALVWFCAYVVGAGLVAVPFEN